jgi:hypothetical protein
VARATTNHRLTLQRARSIVFSSDPGVYTREDVRLTTKRSPIPVGTVIKLFDSTGYHDWDAMVISTFMIKVRGELQVVAQTAPGEYALLDPDVAESARVLSPGFWPPHIVKVGKRHGIPQSYWKPDIDDVVMHIATAFTRRAFYRQEVEGRDDKWVIALSEGSERWGPSVLVRFEDSGYAVTVLDRSLLSDVKRAVVRYGDWVAVIDGKSEAAAIRFILHSRSTQPRRWVASQLIRNGYTAEAAEELLVKHFDTKPRGG